VFAIFFFGLIISDMDKLKKIIINTACIFILLVLSGLAAIAEIKDIGTPFIRNFSKLDYKAGTQNWAIAQAQLEWVVGKNPFNQSEMFGEGYNFSTRYAAFPGDVAGGLPVGIETRLDSDVPFQPPAVLHNYKEIWIHPSSRWLVLLDYLGY
jgi:hypothetical protein